MSTLMAINSAWANRPADTCYSDLNEATRVAKQHAADAKEKKDVPPSTLRIDVESSTGDEKPNLLLVGRGDIPAKLNNWSMGQLSGMIGAPASYLRKLPATLAAQNLNYGMRERFGTTQTPADDKERVNLLVHVNGGLTIRSFNSEQYSRIWDWELLSRCAELQDYGWHNPQPFNTGEQVGTCWVSDHDMILFQVHDTNLIEVPGPDGTKRQLRRGYIMQNSEVGARKWTTLSFLFDFMCCNRMIWGTQSITKIAVRHVGKASERVPEMFAGFMTEVTKYINSSGRDEQAKILRARMTQLGETKAEVVERVFKALKGDLARKTIEAGFDEAKAHPDTDVPATHVWALTNGITRHAQTIPFADERIGVEQAAGKLVDMAF